MKLFIPLFVMFFSCATVFAQKSSVPTEKHFGVALNSPITFSEGFISISPTALYYQNKHQFELGVGFVLFHSNYNRRFTTNFNYKYFLLGLEKRINMYAAADLSYYNLYSRSISYDIDSYGFQVSQVSLFGGFGAQFKFLENAYIGIGVYVGTSSYKSHHAFSLVPENLPRLFEEYEFDGAVKISLGYRF